MPDRPRSILLCLAGLLLAAPTAAQAAKPQASLTQGHAGLELAGGRLDRGSRKTTWRRPASKAVRALSGIEAELGVVWASWDADTKVPSRIIPRGLAVPGAVANPRTAARFATEFLARHIDALAPGADPGDFVLVSNDLSSGIRSVGFVQHHQGLAVVGGQVSFRFKNDRLTVIASEAYPDIVLPVAAITPSGARVSSAIAGTRARGWVEADGLGHASSASSLAGPFVLPVVEGSGAISYREVVRTVVDVAAPVGRYAVYVDARSGEPIARRSLLMHADAEVRYNVPVRGPLGDRYDALAPGAEILENGQPLAQPTSTAGVITFTGPTSELTLGVVGPYVRVSNDSGETAQGVFPATDGGVVVWNTADDEVIDAQLTAFIHAQVVKDYVRNIATDLPWLDEQLPVTVNINDTCNAFSDGNSINFFLGSDSCENTGRIADVVYHEFGHSVHTQSVIPGVGFFDTALSEGVSDYLSATMTNDSGIGRGFFLNDTPLRELNPDGLEYRWPDDRGEVHDEGRIIGGALWDLREVLIAKHGPDAGIALSDRIWYEATRRAVNIPSMYVETLLVDDDDGNLANGTPNVCEINAAYGPHGLFTAGENAERVTLTDTGTGLDVQLILELPFFDDCPVDAGPVVTWRLRDDPSQTGSSAMSTDGEGGWAASIPRIEDQVIQYQVQVNYTTGTERSMPDNFVDPWYETYVGDVVPLYCFSEDPGASAWTFEGTGGNWQVSPALVDDPNDPAAPFDQDGVFIAQDGPYGSFADSRASIEIDTQGFPEVRLQYWRWLTIEDGFWDRATIEADGAPVWSNFESDVEEFATFHHTDREWRFHDVDLSDFAPDGSVALDFAVTSDGGLEFGGWTLDGLCVVGVGAPATCGNGIFDAFEECDDGNRADGDGCSADCTVEDPGDPGGDPSGGEDTDGLDPDDDFPDTDGDPGFGEDGGLIGRGCGCSVRDDTGPGPFFALLLAVGFFTRRRRTVCRHTNA